VGRLVNDRLVKAASGIQPNSLPFNKSRHVSVTALFELPGGLGRLRLSLGVVGIVVASAFLAWMLAGWLGWMPSMVAVFGVEGLRTPASITVGALLIAAIAFWEY
jgi:hypothetical protein